MSINAVFCTFGTIAINHIYRLNNYAFNTPFTEPQHMSANAALDLRQPNEGVPFGRESAFCSVAAASRELPRRTGDKRG